MRVPRILLADDHAVIRHQLRSLLEDQPGWIICAEAADGGEAVELAIRLQPDIAVLDVSMPVMSGLEAAPLIRRGSPTTRILIVTMHESVPLLRIAREAGVAGYLLKSDAAQRLVPAIQALLAQGAP